VPPLTVPLTVSHFSNSGPWGEVPGALAGAHDPPPTLVPPRALVRSSLMVVPVAARKPYPAAFPFLSMVLSSSGMECGTA
jgi:hypothetical protein